MSEIFTRLGRGGARLRAYTDKLTATQAARVSGAGIVAGFLILMVIELTVGASVPVQMTISLMSVAPYAYLLFSTHQREWK